MHAGIKIGIVTLLVVGGLATLHYKPWQTSDAGGRERLEVGFLPVTCHLTCPVTDYASKTSKTTRFDSRRFTDFPTVVETLKAGHIDATFLLAPLAMRLREAGVPVKIVYLGHRDGTEVIVRKDSTATSLKDLKGKTMAIPSRFSNQSLVIHKLMDDLGMAEDDLKFVEMPPPDMPSAIASGAIDSYIIGEPFAAKAELAGTGRVLYFAKDIWPHFISCVLVVSEKLIADRPEEVRDLVRGIAESGAWAESHREEAAKIVAPYYRQDEKLLRYVLTQPPDRVSYKMLTPTDKDMKEIMDAAVKQKLLKGPIDLSQLVDRQFIPQMIGVADIH